MRCEGVGNTLQKSLVRRIEAKARRCYSLVIGDVDAHFHLKRNAHGRAYALMYDTTTKLKSAMDTAATDLVTTAVHKPIPAPQKRRFHVAERPTPKPRKRRLVDTTISGAEIDAYIEGLLAECQCERNRAILQYFLLHHQSDGTVNRHSAPI